MTSSTLPRSSSSGVAVVDDPQMSGRRPSTSWPYQSGVEYDHHDTTTASGSRPRTRRRASVAISVSPERSTARQRAQRDGGRDQQRATPSDGRQRPHRSTGRERRRRTAARSARRVDPERPAATVHDRAREDREPRPREERRPEVVALDGGVHVGRGEEAGRERRDARQQRVARAPAGGHDERDGTRSSEDAELGAGEPHERRRRLPPRSASGPSKSPWNWRASDDRPRSRSTSRAARRPAARGTRPARSGSSRYSSAATPKHAPSAARIEPRPPQHARLDREHVQPDRPGRAAASGRGSRAHAEHRRPRARSPGRRGAQARVVRRPPGAPTSRSQRSSAGRRSRRSSEVQRVGVRRDADRARRAASARTRSPPRPRPAAGTSSRRTTRTTSPPPPATSSADSRFMRNAGDPSGARTSDATQPSSDVGREPGRVHRARASGAPSGPRPCPTRPRRAAASSGRRRTPHDDPGRRSDRACDRASRRAAGRRYQPRSWPQVDAPQVDEPRRRPRARSRSAAAGRPAAGRARARRAAAGTG